MSWLDPPQARRSTLGRVYAAGAAWHRWYASREGRQRRLRQPVISVGSLSAGGAGKTSFAALLARMLLSAGERPAILSRGYARERQEDGVVVVRDAAGVRAGLQSSGDEPLMLARMLPGCAVLVASDRHMAGALAETRLDCTVHILDDGFQHFRLKRDIDLLLVDCDDLLRGQTLPRGRLRESPATASLADAWIGPRNEVTELVALAARAGVSRVFGISRTIGVPTVVGSARAGAPVNRDAPVLLVSGLARPQSFEADVRAAGWIVAGHMAFPDHHRYVSRDMRAIADRATTMGAEVVLTTEKDLVRLEPLRPWPVTIATVPLAVRLEAEETFMEWIVERLNSSRQL